MRYVALAGLEPLTAKARDTGGQLVDAPFAFADLVRYLIDGDKRFVSDGAGIRSASRVEAQLAKANGFLALEEADWARLKEAAESPSVPYPLAPPRRLSPFLGAISEATEKHPKGSK
jgi:hypothetical protein